MKQLFSVYDIRRTRLNTQTGSKSTESEEFSISLSAVVPETNKPTVTLIVPRSIAETLTLANTFTLSLNDSEAMEGKIVTEAEQTESEER